MKKMMIALVAMLTIAATGKAMSYEQARNEALFLTDKMAYELNLTDEQYEAAYEINLDYLMGVTSYDDVYSTYWERRNLDMSYILFDWQWQAFCAATYFYRPLYWDGGFWHFAIYARYPHRDYFYFGRPAFYATYRGGHAWHVVGGHGYYHSHRDHFRPEGRSHFGMLDRWNRGDYRGNHRHSGRDFGHSGGNRTSSTRTTVNGNRDFGHRDRNNNDRGLGNHNGSGTNHGLGNGNHNNNDRGLGNHSGNGNNRNFGSGPSSSSRPATSNNRPSTSVDRNSGSFSSHSSRPSMSTSRPSASSDRSSGSFSSRPSSSSSSSRSSGSFSSRPSSSSSRSGGSFSGGHSSSSRSSGGHSSSGGRSFGGRR